MAAQDCRGVRSTRYRVKHGQERLWRGRDRGASWTASQHTLNVRSRGCGHRETRAQVRVRAWAAGNGEQNSTELVTQASGDESPRVQGCLDYNHGPCESRDDAVAGWKLAGSRWRPWRVLRQQATRGSDTRKQVGVAIGVGDVGAAAQDREGGHTTGKSALVRGRIDTKGAARDNRRAALAQPSGNRPCAIAARSGSRPSANDG
jgi:hypothetical protein